MINHTVVGVRISYMATSLIRIVFLSTFFLSSLTLVSAQEKVITAGIQFKPIFSSKFFNTGPESSSANGFDFTITPKSGYCIGMVIRKGFTNTISLETGINYVKRNYNIKISDYDSSYTEKTDFGIVGYEIPVLGLVFIQLSDQIFMDVALGASLDFYPSDVKSAGDRYAHHSFKHSWFSPSVLGNLGWEYRTEKSGYFYLGASYHRPFTNTYTSFIFQEFDESSVELQGNYLTFDIRYFFHSDPQKRKKKVRKNNPKEK